MTKKEQIEFINEMCDSLKIRMLSKAERIPENWDGYELRQYLVDKANGFCTYKMETKRKNRYNNDIITLNL